MASTITDAAADPLALVPAAGAAAAEVEAALSEPSPPDPPPPPPAASGAAPTPAELVWVVWMAAGLESSGKRGKKT